MPCNARLTGKNRWNDGMRMKTLSATALALALAACQPPEGKPAGQPAPDRTSGDSKRLPQEHALDKVIHQIMQQQYGGKLDVNLKCWIHETTVAGEDATYCMKPGQPKVVADGSRKRLYFIASNHTDSAGPYSYSHSKAGLLGAFEVEVNGDGSWQILAASTEMLFGSSGICGCVDAEFTQLGRDYYGWSFVSGGSWQGVSVLANNIIAPREGKFVDISEVPFVTEENQDVEYHVKVEKDGGEGEIFPLTLYVKENGKTVDERRIEFDRDEWLYKFNVDDWSSDNAQAIAAGSDIEQLKAANVPNEVIAMLKPKDVLLAYRESSPDKEHQVAVAVIGHDLKPDSNDIKENPCTMLIMDSERRVLFENDKVVDCTYNEGNQKALPLELTDDLTVEPNRISFVNENIRGGSYGYTFGFSRERDDWYLLSARSVYKRAEPSEDGYAVMVEEKVRYPVNIKYISFADFDHEMISEELHKSAVDTK